MPSRIKPYPVVETLIDMFADWLQYRRATLEVCRCDSDELARLAHDLAVTPDDLMGLVRKGPHAADELPRLLDALGIDEEGLALAQPLMLRDMARVCTGCQHKNQCQDDLATGASTRHYQDYCGNAATIAALDPEQA